MKMISFGLTEHLYTERLLGEIMNSEMKHNHKKTRLAMFLISFLNESKSKKVMCFINVYRLLVK